MNAHILDSMRELHSRVVVAVEDAKTGDDFVIDVRGDDRAMDVFHHPYAYAAWRRIPTRLAGPRPALAGQT